MLPVSSIRVHCDTHQFHWRIIGTGPPFIVPGGPQHTLHAPVGWCGAYVEVIVKPKPGNPYDNSVAKIEVNTYDML